VFEHCAGAATAEFADQFSQMMFLRIAMLIGSAAPILTLRVDTGAPVVLRLKPQPLFSQPANNRHVGTAWLTTQTADTLDIAIGLTDGAEHEWSLGIANAAAGAGDQYTWVVADTAADIDQTWVRTAITEYQVEQRISIKGGSDCGSAPVPSQCLPDQRRRSTSPGHRRRSGHRHDRHLPPPAVHHHR
jgi:hypothetical protein